MRAGSTGDPLAQRLTAEGHRRCGHRVVHRGDDGRGLEQERELGVPRIERQRRAIENLDRLPEALSAAERRVASTIVALAAAAASGAASTASASAPASRRCPTLASAIPRSSSSADRSPGRRWFSERSAQEDRLRLGSTSAFPPRTAAADQPLDDPAIVGGLADEQVLGNARVGARLLGEQLGGTAVALRALGAGELRVDAARGRADARTSAAGRARGCPRSPAGRPHRLPRALRGPRVAPLAAGRSARGPPALARAARHARAAEGAGGEPSDRRFVHRFRCFLAQCRRELAHEERRPARHAQAGVDDVRIRSLDRASASEEFGNGGSRQRGETDRISRWNRSSPSRKQLGIGARLARAGRDDERGVQLFEPRKQEGQVTEGCGVCPVRVVDDQAERA